VCLCVTVAGCGEGRHGSTPAGDPRAAVTGFLAAISSGDASAAKAYCTEDFANRIDTQNDSWLHQRVTVSVVSFGREETLSPKLVGASSDTQVVNLPAVLSLQQEHSTTRPNGSNVRWGFQVRRLPGDKGWLIGDEGVG
jgi:hypothetical protein